MRVAFTLAIPAAARPLRVHPAASLVDAHGGPEAHLAPVFTPTTEWVPTEFFEWDNFTGADRGDALPSVHDQQHGHRGDERMVGVLLPRPLLGSRSPGSGSVGAGALLHPDRDDADPVAVADGAPVPLLREAQSGLAPTYLDHPVVHRDRVLHLPDPALHAHDAGSWTTLRADGLNTWQIFWRIILPLSTPVLTVCAVFTFLWRWNDLLGPLIIWTARRSSRCRWAQNLVTLADTPWNLTMAANLVPILACGIACFFVQKKSTRTLRGLKG